jgi:hypothetical protein
LSDGWADRGRPEAAARSVVVDVPLTGIETAPGPGGETAEDLRPAAPNWRRALAIALVGGTIVGVGGAVLMFDSGDDTDATRSTSLPTDGLAAAITTPPTLQPLDTLPRPDDPSSGTTGASADTTGDDRSSAVVPVPTYPEVEPADLADIVQYDLSAAVDQLADDLPRRSETHLELGVGGFALDVTLTRDPIRDRYEVTVRSGRSTQVAIVDVATGTTYINPGTDEPTEILNADIIAGSDATTVNEYFDRLLVGPLRPETYTPTATRGRGLVSIDGVGVARQFVTNIRGELIPEWQLYAFGPVFEFPVEDRPSLLEYSVYVDGVDRIAQIDGVSLVGDVPQLIRHRITVLDEPVEIDLPHNGADRPPSDTTASIPAPTTPASTPPSTGG